MARKWNSIDVEQLESKDKGNINHVNVKHMMRDQRNTSEGVKVVIKLNSH